jgi:FkbM family methyltransferase
MWRTLGKKLRNTRQQIGELGPGAAIQFKLQRWRMRLAREPGPYRLRSRNAAAPLWVRPDTSDVLVFEQIFVEREYRCLDGIETAQLVIDCGANVGYSSAYFLSRFPESHVIALEPEQGNFECLRRNLAPYAGRVELIQAAVWSHPARLVLESPEFYGGKEWVYRVREACAGEQAEIEATDLGAVWRKAGRPAISVLKMDIEGSEAAVFAAPDQSWLEAVQNLVIELHSEECAEVFTRAIEGQGFEVARCGELTVCRRAPS